MARGSYKGGPDNQRRWTVTYQLISELRYPYDARSYSDGELIRIACRIQSFGLKLPILVDADSMVFAGRGLILACDLLQYRALPTICLRNVSGGEARNLEVAVDRLCELYEWNSKLLPGQLRELRVLDQKFADRYDFVLHC
jgi:hypothetical protein